MKKKIGKTRQNQIQQEHKKSSRVVMTLEYIRISIQLQGFLYSCKSDDKNINLKIFFLH